MKLIASFRKLLWAGACKRGKTTQIVGNTATKHKKQIRSLENKLPLHDESPALLNAAAGLRPALPNPGPPRPLDPFLHSLYHPTYEITHNLLPLLSQCPLPRLQAPMQVAPRLCSLYN